MDKILVRIDNKRKEKNLTQADICIPLGIKANNYTGWLRGEVTSYKQYLPQIAEILGVTVDYLANGTETEYDEFLALYRNAPDDIREAIVTILKRCTKK